VEGEGLLVVEIGARRLAVPTARVREVAAAAAVTPVPSAPAPIAGLTQLRGQILPVLDLGDSARAPHPSDPLVVIELGAARAALLVDRVIGLGSGEGAERLDVGSLFEQVRQGVRP
jgi:purine-binding chemotaxis protein CheW